MTQYLPIIVLSSILAFLVTPLTRWLAHRVGMVDQPGLRKTHRSPVPLLGGMALYIGVILAFILFGQRDWLTEGLGIFGGVTLMFFTGLWDDRYGMPARLKLAACVVAGLFLVAFGVQVKLFDVWWLDALITLLWVVGITNAANLMDNMDGLAAGLASVAGVFFFVLAALEGQGLVASLAAALVGSALGFLFYNLAPAVSFMGDAGSLTLGFLLAALGIKLRFASFPLGSTWMVPIVVLGVFIFDTTLVTLSRLRRGRSPFQGGSDHTSHRLAQIGLSPPRAVLTMYVAAVSLGALAILMTRLPALNANLIFGGLVFAGLVALFFFERIEPKLSGDPLLVLIPGGGGFASVLAAVSGVSRNLVVLIAPQRVNGELTPSRADVIEAYAGVAEEPAAVRALLERGLSDDWLDQIPALSRALRLAGAVIVLDVSQPELSPQAILAMRKAKAILLGPGDLDGNVRAMLAMPEFKSALDAPSRVVIQVETSSSVEPLPGTRFILLAQLSAELQKHLLHQAAARAKTQRIS
jgi:UDP-GlcNAc:undecaprenyl-phosphate GlcNAc-1-phosphate transferase